MTGLTDNEVKFLQERFAASNAGLEAAELPWTYDNRDECLFNGNNMPLFERSFATESDASYVVAVVNMMPRLFAHYLELRAKVNQDAEEGDKQSRCEGCNEADGIAFTADDVWLCMECLEGCDVEPNP